jgi:hypothetical protein
MKLKKTTTYNGLRNEEWEGFEKEIEYDAFLAKRKNN